MKRNLTKRGIVAEKSSAVGTVTRSMVRQRAAEIAILNGRSAREIEENDWEQAKRELTGGQYIDPRELKEESVPSWEHWAPGSGSRGHQAPATLNDEDRSENESDAELLTEQGMNEAEHERMVQAEKQIRRRERS